VALDHRTVSVDDVRDAETATSKTDALDKLAPEIQYHGLRRHEQGDFLYEKFSKPILPDSIRRSSFFRSF